MKTKLTLFLLLAASTILPSCELGLNFLNPAGKTKTVERPLPTTIAKVVVDDDVDVTVFIDPAASQRAVVTAGENIISGIKTEISDSTITIKNTNTFAWTSSFKNKKQVTLYLNSSFATLEYYGDGNVSVLDTIKENSFTYHCSESSGEVSILLKANNAVIDQQSCVSDLRVFGSCNNATVTYRGSGWIYLDKFVANNMSVTSYGSGDIYVNVINSLMVSIKSIGNIVYSGNPTIALSKDGTGNLVKE